MRAQHSYVIRVDGSVFRALVMDPSPAIDGRTTRWIMTDLCVLGAECAWCDSKIGEPCKTRDRSAYTSSTHADRRCDFARLRRKDDEFVRLLIAGAGVAARVSNDLLRGLVSSEQDAG